MREGTEIQTHTEPGPGKKQVVGRLHQSGAVTLGQEKHSLTKNLNPASEQKIGDTFSPGFLTKGETLALRSVESRCRGRWAGSYFCAGHSAEVRRRAGATFQGI